MKGLEDRVALLQNTLSGIENEMTIANRIMLIKTRIELEEKLDFAVIQGREDAINARKKDLEIVNALIAEY